GTERKPQAGAPAVPGGTPRRGTHPRASWAGGDPRPPRRAVHRRTFSDGIRAGAGRGLLDLRRRVRRRGPPLIRQRPMKLELEGKRALVSGSTAGIGWAIAAGLAAEGAEVVLNGRTEARVRSAVEQVRARHPRAVVRGIAADLGTAEGCARVVHEVPAVDVLVNNLGIFAAVPFDDI